MIHPAMWGRFPQGSNTYFLFNSYIEYTELKIDEGRSIRTFFFLECFNRRWVKAGGMEQKVLFKAS